MDNQDVKMAPDKIVKRNSDILSSEFSEKTTILMHMDTGKYYELDTIASHIWKKLEHPIAIAALGRDMVLFYRGRPAEIISDTHRVLDYLIEERLVDVIS
jgi:hypothetical protein